MFKNVKGFLEKIVQKTKEDKKTEEFKKTWKKTINKKIKTNTTVVSFSKNTLTLKAKNPTWKTELLFVKDKIKKKLTNNNQN